ncbi:MAG: hypothetical protein OXG72_20375 [Acidobacteria bacterium]|nr:hypothetical protein [Acidobacteriota bacterium]
MDDQLFAQSRVDPRVRPAVEQPPGNPDRHGADAEPGELVQALSRIREHAVDGSADDQRKQGPARSLEYDQGQGESEAPGKAFQQRIQQRILRR